MPRQLKPGDVINGYTVREHLNTGAMANAFAATDRAGKKVFFKSYKSPTCAVPWYRGYVDYQRELKRRLEGHLVGKFCVKLVDQFEFKFGIPTFFQAFEFVHSGQDLGQILDKLRKHPRELDWNQRHILAKVMMAAIHQLHDAKIVHGDLKPPNLQLFRDKEITAGYQLKLIDMDFSILADRRAPWHGNSAYVGTPGYFSPEHLAGGKAVPEPASDVFTCGLILYELLAQGHPYRFDSDDEYRKAAETHTAKKPELLGQIEGSAKLTETLAGMLHRCLAPEAEDRPTAKEVHLALNGRLSESASPRVDRPCSLPPVTEEPEPTVAETNQTIRLTNGAGAKLDLRVKTTFGKHLLRTFGEDAKYADDLQFIIEKRDGQWWVTPSPNPTSNLTLHNGKPVDVRGLLKSGDQLALGSRNTPGKCVLPITVTLI
jgi:serine/threonine protein kinase